MPHTFPQEMLIPSYMYHRIRWIRTKRIHLSFEYFPLRGIIGSVHKHSYIQDALNRTVILFNMSHNIRLHGMHASERFCHAIYYLEMNANDWREIYATSKMLCICFLPMRLKCLPCCAVWLLVEMRSCIRLSLRCKFCKAFPNRISSP